MLVIFYVLLLPVVVILVGTWAFRYQPRRLELFQRADLAAGRRPIVRLREVAVTGRDLVDLVLEDRGARPQQFVVNASTMAIATLRRWHDGRARLHLIVPAGRNIVRLRRDDGHEALTLRRVGEGYESRVWRAAAVTAPRIQNRPIPTKKIAGTSFQLAVITRNATTPHTTQETPTASRNTGELGRRPTWPGVSSRPVERRPRAGCAGRPRRLRDWAMRVDPSAASSSRSHG